MAGSATVSAQELSKEEAAEWGRLGISCFWPDGRFERAADATSVLPDIASPSLLSKLEQYLAANRSQGGDRFRVLRVLWRGGILGLEHDTLLVLHVDEGILSDTYRIGLLHNLIPPIATCDLAQKFGPKP
tara:strand:- start:344 stop:733 length:390 start_codon:yes stop_codon:yes gene_type:complete